MIDETSWQILEALQVDARQSYAELGRQVGLSPPAVAERVRRLEEAGIITGYRAVVNPEALGYGIAALIELTTTPQQYPQVIERLERLNEVRSCHHITGKGSFQIHVIARSIAHLEQMIGELSHFGQTATSIIFSTPVRKSVLSRPLY